MVFFFVYKAGGWHLNSFDLPVRHVRRVGCERKKERKKETKKERKKERRKDLTGKELHQIPVALVI